MQPSRLHRLQIKQTEFLIIQEERDNSLSIQKVPNVLIGHISEKIERENKIYYLPNN